MKTSPSPRSACAGSPPPRRRAPKRAAAIVAATLVGTTMAAVPASATVDGAAQVPFDLTLPAIQDTINIREISTAINGGQDLFPTGNLNIAARNPIAGLPFMPAQPESTVSLS